MFIILPFCPISVYKFIQLIRMHLSLRHEATRMVRDEGAQRTQGCLALGSPGASATREMTLFPGPVTLEVSKMEGLVLP